LPAIRAVGAFYGKKLKWARMVKDQRLDPFRYLARSLKRPGITSLKNFPKQIRNRLMEDRSPN
jgi:hypothetical protein